MSILDEIVVYKRQEIAVLKYAFDEMGRIFDPDCKRNFAFSKALQKRKITPHLIAEIKPASPSEGKLFGPEDSVEKFAKLYENFGASAISVLTDTKFFGASMDNLVAARETTELPLLLKDFVIDEIQIHDACEHGADAVLLMRSILSSIEIQEFLDILKSKQMDALVETHTEAELIDVLENTTAKIIGINNRDLNTMEVHPEYGKNLLASIPEELTINRTFIIESGLKSQSDVRRFANTAQGILVGTSIIRSADRAKTLRELRCQPQVKICGITQQEDALIAAEQANSLGFIFVENSPRFLSAEKAETITKYVRGEFFSAAPKIVGVFVNPTVSELKKYEFLDVFQLHGDETPEQCAAIQQAFPEQQIWKAIRVQEMSDLEKAKHYANCDCVLFDAYSAKSNGGTGKQIPLEILKKIPEILSPDQQFFIAGGVTSENLPEIIQSCLPDGIDLASGVESSPGKKDQKKLQNVFDTLKAL